MCKNNYKNWQTVRQNVTMTKQNKIDDQNKKKKTTTILFALNLIAFIKKKIPKTKKNNKTRLHTKKKQKKDKN